MAFNNSTLVGRLTADPELRYTANAGKPVANFTVAVDRDFVAEGGQEVDFIPVVVWGKLAEVVAEHKRKGDQVLVNGRIQVRAYENSEGQKVRVTEVVAETVQFLGNAKREETPEPEQETPKQDKAPKGKYASGKSYSRR